LPVVVNPANAPTTRHLSWWWLLAFQVLVLILPLLITGLFDFSMLRRLARAAAADVQAAFVGFGFLGLPLFIAMSLARYFRRDAFWLRGLWMITGLMALVALAVFSVGHVIHTTRGTSSFAWPLTTLVQWLVLACVSLMWWLLRLVSDAPGDERV
jgi:hypothetical protein